MYIHSRELPYEQTQAMLIECLLNLQAIALETDFKQSCVDSKQLEQDSQHLHREEGVAARYMRELEQQIGYMQTHSGNCLMRHRGLLSSSALHSRQLQVSSAVSTSQ